MSLANSLRKMGILLDQHWCRNVTNTDVLQSNIKTLGYSIRKKPLIFKNINVGKHIRPNIDLNKSELQVKLCSYLNLEKVSNRYTLKSLGLNINIEGKCLMKENKEEKDLMFSFHIDYEGNSKSEFYHPISHLQIGSDAIKDSDTGSLLKVEQPRFSHYPMDVILAIDFIIHNFYTNKQHKKFTSLPAYRNIVKESATKYIKPYIESIYSYWNNEIENKDFKPYDAICSLPK